MLSLLHDENLIVIQWKNNKTNDNNIIIIIIIVLLQQKCPVSMEILVVCKFHRM